MTEGGSNLLRTWAWTVILQNAVIVALFGVAGLAFALGWTLPIQALGTLLGYVYGAFLRPLYWATGETAQSGFWIPVVIEFSAVLYGWILAWNFTRLRTARGDARLRSPYLFGLTVASCGALLLVFALLGI